MSKFRVARKSMSVHEDHQNLDIVEEIYIHNACTKICFIGVLCCIT